MNYQLPQIPERTKKPRKDGITMVMDKGLSIQETHNFISVAEPYIDLVKLGFGTSMVTPNLKEKLAVYAENNIPVYLGGTLFEAFLIRNCFDEYLQMIQDYGLKYVEVSDGSISIPHSEKCGYIEKLSFAAVCHHQRTCRADRCQRQHDVHTRRQDVGHGRRRHKSRRLCLC
jgi:phosphosulfolactate synthase